MSGKRLWCVVVLIALVLIGCPAANNQASEPVTSSSSRTNEDREASRGSAPSAPVPRPNAAPRRGETARYTARLDMDRLSGSKRLQATELLLEDGRRLLIAYREVKKWFRYVGKRVIVEGQHYTNPPGAQSVRAEHFSVTSIELAPGETPYASEPTQLPTPDTVKNRAEFEARDGQWVQLFATLKTGSRHPDHSWCDAVALLGDGTEIWASISETAFGRVWKPLFGKQVSMIGRAHRDTKDAKRPLKLISQVAVCAGKVARCGMGLDVHLRNRGPIKIR